MFENLISNLDPTLCILPPLEIEDYVAKDIAHIYQLFNSMGIKVKIVNEYTRSKLFDLFDTISIAEIHNYNFLIYYHVCHWEIAKKILRRFSGKVIIRTTSTFLCNANQFQEDTNLLKELNFDYGKFNWFIDSSHKANQLISHHINPESIHIIPFFRSPKLITTPRNRGGNSFKLLYTGRFCLENGQIHLLHILNTYIKHYQANIELVLAGNIVAEEVDYLNYLIKFIETFKINSKVRLEINISKDLLETFYSRSNAYISMSEYEDDYEYLLMAQCYGLPIIAGSNANIQTYLGEIPIATLPEKLQDYRFFASILNEIIHNTRLYQSLSNAGYKNIVTNHACHKIEAKLLQCYFSLLEKKQ